MKKTICLLLAALVALALLPVASADGEPQLPYELVAPANVTAHWLEGGDSPTTTNLVYSLSNEMTDFYKRMEYAHLDDTFEQFMAPYDFDEIWMSVQIDWALDDVDDPVSGWHYTEYWDGDPVFGLGHDSEGNARWSEWDLVDAGIGNATETTNEIWITRGVPNDERWNGNPETNTPGVKDQLRPDQYTYEIFGDGDGQLTIDYTQHTMYFRARFVVTTRTEAGNTYTFSEWSSVASVGKDAVQYEPLNPGDLPAPVITGLRMTDYEFNGYPVAAFTLTVPDELAEKVAHVTAAGGYVWIEVEGRFLGTQEWKGMQGDWIIKAGEMEVDLMSLAEDDKIMPKEVQIEMRCRYWCGQPDRDEFRSDYSNVITFGSDDFGHFMYGDVDRDDNVTASDALMALKQAVGKIDLNERDFIAADVDGSDKVDASDALLILKKVVGKIQQFPVEVA